MQMADLATKEAEVVGLEIVRQALDKVIELITVLIEESLIDNYNKYNKQNYYNSFTFFIIAELINCIFSRHFVRIIIERLMNSYYFRYLL